MSDVSCKVPLLMETNQMTDTETDTPSTNTTVARFAELQALVAGMEADFQKFYNAGNKAAGTRVRNAMQELKAFAQTVRNEVSSIKNEGGKPGGDSSDADA
jgi:gamma-glutamyl:cysteine ligase YbdK (ATP-grasp superfamily)